MITRFLLKMIYGSNAAATIADFVGLLPIVRFQHYCDVILFYNASFKSELTIAALSDLCVRNIERLRQAGVRFAYKLQDHEPNRGNRPVRWRAPSA